MPAPMLLITIFLLKPAIPPNPTSRIDFARALEQGKGTVGDKP